MKKVFIILFMLSWSYVGWSQTSPPKELHFNHLYIEDGLPERSILSLFQDKEGYMWIGTGNGLVRYDGYKPKVYKFGIEGFLVINNIYEDRKGILWVGTGRGLYRYDRAKDHFIQYNPRLTDSTSLSEGVIFGIHDDPSGNLWILLGEAPLYTSTVVVIVIQ
jgi:ligand-binding sensor domain-containing protein